MTHKVKPRDLFSQVVHGLPVVLCVLDPDAVAVRLVLLLEGSDLALDGHTLGGELCVSVFFQGSLQAPDLVGYCLQRSLCEGRVIVFDDLPGDLIHTSGDLFQILIVFPDIDLHAIPVLLDRVVSAVLQQLLESRILGSDVLVGQRSEQFEQLGAAILPPHDLREVEWIGQRPERGFVHQRVDLGLVHGLADRETVHIVS